MDVYWQIDDNTFNVGASGSAVQHPPIAHQPLQQQQQMEQEGENSSSTLTAGPTKEELTEAIAPQVSSLIEQLTAAGPVSGGGGDEVTERDKVLCLLSHFDNDQLERYEAFRRGAFAKSVIRMIMQTVSGRLVSQNAVIAMAGITKVYIGEIVEEALRFRQQQRQSAKFLNEGGEVADNRSMEEDKEPLKPSHIYEALRRLEVDHTRTPEFRL